VEVPQTTRVFPDIAAPSNCGLEQTPLSCRDLRSQTKANKQGGNAMPSSRIISANGIELLLLERGDGPLVVLCHAGRNHPNLTRFLDANRFHFA
jgi:hypothetical protein